MADSVFNGIFVSGRLRWWVLISRTLMKIWIFQKFNFSFRKNSEIITSRLDYSIYIFIQPDFDHFKIASVRDHPSWEYFKNHHGKSGFGFRFFRIFQKIQPRCQSGNSSMCPRSLWREIWRSYPASWHCKLFCHFIMDSSMRYWLFKSYYTYNFIT